MSNTGGYDNTAVGFDALYHNTVWENAAIGANALFGNRIGLRDTATGVSALSANSSGNDNTAVALQALQNNSTGNANTAVGGDALVSNTGGIYNTAVGSFALAGNTRGGYNIAVGVEAGSNVATAHGVICIGADGENGSNSCYIGQIFGRTSTSGATVFVNANGRLGTSTSSRRFKNAIKPMDKASEQLYALQPITFRYKGEIGPAGTSQFGLVPEDVEKVNRDLVVRDGNGEPYSVRYDQVNAMLLNEFLKEHRKVEELQATVAELTARLDEQDSKRQRMSDQLEVSKHGPRVVANQ